MCKCVVLAVFGKMNSWGGLVGYDAALTRLRSRVQFPALVFTFISPRSYLHSYSYCRGQYIYLCFTFLPERSHISYKDNLDNKLVLVTFKANMRLFTHILILFWYYIMRMSILILWNYLPLDPVTAFTVLCSL